MTRDPKIATAGNAPEPRPEGTRMKERHDPIQPAVAPFDPIIPVRLTELDAERFRTACLVLMALADELGLFMLTISAHKVTAPTAFGIFPEGTEPEHSKDGAGAPVWVLSKGSDQPRLGYFEAMLFTGEPEIGEAA